MTGVGQVLIDDAQRRRRLGLPPGPPPVVQPVPGTNAAVTAAQQALNAQGAAPHILEQPAGTQPAKGEPHGMPKGMSAVEVADQIVAQLLQGTGPILLLAPGTNGTAYQTSMLALGRAALQEAGATAPPSIASVPYPNGIKDILTRALKIGVAPANNVLSLVLHRLAAAAPHRPILLAGESQGAWLIADTLRMEPQLAAIVTRVALFAKPGNAASPTPGTVGTSTGLPTSAVGIQEWAHVDDIVPNIPRGILSGPVLGGFTDALRGLMATGKYHYTPHHYDRYGTVAAHWLLFGTQPPATKLRSTDPLPA